MKTKRYLEHNKIINVLMMILLCLFTIFTTYWWGRYVMLVCILAIFCLQLLRDRGKYKLMVPALTIMMAIFLLYTLMGVFWAKHPFNTVVTARTLFEILIMVYVLYVCYFDNPQCVDNLLGCIKWASYITSIYSIFFYGVDFLIKISLTGDRLDNAYANVNTIGMLAAIGIVIQVDKSLREKRIGSSFLCIPSIILIAVTQSRKALIALAVGIFLCIILHNIDSKNILKTVGKLLVFAPLALILLYGITSLPIFAGLMERMNSWIAGSIGIGSLDSSALIRNRMVEIGLNQFLETPIFGIGMANAYLLNLEHLGTDTYLHNNYVELLAGGGIIGFILYYSMYAYILTMFIKYREHKNKEYVICLVMAVISLMLDFGMVSYYSKIRYIYIIVLFLEVEQLKKTQYRMD